jgi:hypothetical protein
MGRRYKLSKPAKAPKGDLVKLQIKLSAATAAVAEGSEEQDRVWVQIAAEGEYKGYAGGSQTFTFNEAVFGKIVANFRAHPSFSAGPDGFGNQNVVAWDFHHASEMPATEGTIPVAGAPAQGWVQDLAVRKSETGAVELWALTHWLEPAKTYIKEGRYQWASVSVIFNAVDARTAAALGPVLTSVALTNNPFIEGMNKLAADMRCGGVWVDRATDLEHANSQIRSILGLPTTSDLSAMVGELAKVKQWVLTGQEPVGVDLDDIIAGLRTILNLPILTTGEEVFAEVDKLMARLAQESEVSEPGSPGTTPEPPAGTITPPASTGNLENKNMNLLVTLAEKFGVVQKEEAVIEAVDGLVTLRQQVAGNLNLSKESATKVVLKAVATDADVRAKYTAILGALGVENPESALDKITQLIADGAKLVEMAPEFAALKAKEAQAEEAEIEADVEAAAASTGVAATSASFAGLKLALTALRKADKEKFYASYPKEVLRKPPAPKTTVTTTPEILMSKITAAVGGGQRPAPSTADQAVDVSGYEGANLILKTAAHIRASVAGAANWPWDRVHEQASKMVATGAVRG